MVLEEFIELFNEQIARKEKNIDDILDYNIYFSGIENEVSSNGYISDVDLYIDDESNEILVKLQVY